jgi:hypothetical protein
LAGETELKLRDFIPQMNYTDREAAACRRSLVPNFADIGCRVVSETNPHGRNFGFLDRSRYFFEVAPQLSKNAYKFSI